MNALNKQGHSPLHEAVINNHVGAVRCLLESGAKPTTQTKFKIAPLHSAAHFGNIHCVQALLDFGANIDCQESWGQTPLMLAVIKGHQEVAKQLLLRGCDRELGDYQSGKRALHFACECKDVEMIQILLDGGCDVNGWSSNGSTPLEVSIIVGYLPAVYRLIANGGRCVPERLGKIRRSSRRTAITAAAESWGRIGVVLSVPCTCVIL